MTKRLLYGQFLTITFIIWAFVGTAHSFAPNQAAISFVSNALIATESKKAIIEAISDDASAHEWIIINGNVLHSVYALRVPEAQNKKPVVVKTIERDTMKLAVLRAETNIALYLDKGRLNREVYTDKEAADFALRTFYSAKLQGVQSSTSLVENIAVGLVSASLNNIASLEEALPENIITENYCSYLYNKAQNSFNKGDYNKALETFRQIHFLAWANVNAYLGASLCFLKMDKPDDAGKLASELFTALSGDMTPDQKASTAKLLFHSNRKDEAFSVLMDAFTSLKSK